MKGKKYDTGKPRVDLTPPSAILSMARGFTYGADKYNDRNWEKGINYGRLYAALQRHLNAWWNGENKDDESRLSHLDHAFCCLAMLNEMRIRNNQPEKLYDEDLDTRPFPAKEKLTKFGEYYENQFSERKRKKASKLHQGKTINVIPEAEGTRLEVRHNGRKRKGHTYVTESNGDISVRYRGEEPRETERVEDDGTSVGEHRNGQDTSRSI